MADARPPDRRDCLSAYDCRARFPALSAWMSDDDLKQVEIWHGARFETGQEYFDLDNPARGPFVATGDEHRPTDHTYVTRANLPERIWARLATWDQLVSESQAQALDAQVRSLGIGQGQSAAGEAHPRPPR